MERVENVKCLAIELRNITFAYGGLLVFDQMSLSFSKGEIHGILGPNGAGKSTLIKVISGLLRPAEGAVILNGQNTSDDFSLFGSQIGLLSDRPPLYSTMSVSDYLRFCAAIKKVKNVKSCVDELIKKLSLEHVANSIIQTLSTGFRQRVALAQALVHNPPILILDEPTTGLDPQSAANLRQVLLELSKNHTVLFSSHVLHEVQHLCTHTTMVNKGKIIFHGSMQQMLSLGVDVQPKMRIYKIIFSTEYLVSSEELCLLFSLKSSQIIRSSDKRIEIELSVTSIKEINSILRTIFEQNFYIEEVIEKKQDLEESFLQLITQRQFEEKQ